MKKPHVDTAVNIATGITPIATATPTVSKPKLTEIKKKIVKRKPVKRIK